MKQETKSNIMKATKKVALGMGVYIGKKSLDFGLNYVASKFSFRIITDTSQNIHRHILCWVMDNCEDNLTKYLIFPKFDSVKPINLAYGIYKIVYKDHLIIFKSSYRYKSRMSVDKLNLVNTDTKNSLDLTTIIIGKNSTDIGKELINYIREQTEYYLNIKMYDGVRNKVVGVCTTNAVKDLDDIYTDNIDIIKHKIDSYMSNKSYYNDKKLPYKYSLLFHGDPGTGKSTLAKSIAKYLNYDLLYLEPKDFTSQFIINAGAELDHMVILIEDIDRYLDAEGDIPNLGTIMNSLDGVISPTNILFIATTNFIHKLPEALIRKARFDEVIEIKPIESEKVAINMCKYYDIDPNEVLSDDIYPINQSSLQSKILDTKFK